MQLDQDKNQYKYVRRVENRCEMKNTILHCFYPSVVLVYYYIPVHVSVYILLEYFIYLMYTSRSIYLISVKYFSCIPTCIHYVILLYDICSLTVFYQQICVVNLSLLEFVYRVKFYLRGRTIIFVCNRFAEQLYKYLFVNATYKILQQLCKPSDIVHVAIINITNNQ